MAASWEQRENEGDRPLLEALEFPLNAPDVATGSPEKRLTEEGEDEKNIELMCLFCEEVFNVKDTRDDFLRHLVVNHKLVIADFRDITDFKGYIDYWRQRFREKPVTEFCSVIQTNSRESDPEPSELYYLLCDALPEDRDLRHQLQKDRLQKVLVQQQRERDDTHFSKGCLFCKEHFTGNRADLFNHLANDHNFNVGHPDNLVYTDELLEHLETKLERLQCLYCERTFKDRHVLKEHMRKKQHKKVNPQNKDYDKYYVINYLEFGKNWEAIQSEDDKGLDEDESPGDDDWNDWREEESEGGGAGGVLAVCLFCQLSSPASHIMNHMKVEHNFNLEEKSALLQLNFYQKVKLVNYIRRQVHQSLCPMCSQSISGDSEAKVSDHMSSAGHSADSLPEISVWDQPEYFFPTYENDNLLCALEDNEEVVGSDRVKSSVDSNLIIAEDISLPDEEVKKMIVSELVKPQ